MKNVPELFGSHVFNRAAMRERLPKTVFNELEKITLEGRHLELDVANTVAAVMRDWAVGLGATHFTHWFQPMTGSTAEKHDSFISPSKDGNVIMAFSGNELVRGEPDASSFPSGGLRATFEARGYTVWDTTSPVFVKDGTLYIPTVFFSYSGEALDRKTPLLRSMEVLNKQAIRILKLFGFTSQNVTTYVGPEQEYFLLDRELYLKRPDLTYTGRTLFGAPPVKGQELDDHYFGSIKPRVAAYMRELEEELWKYGITAKTKHNEVAPSQHELAPIYTKAHIAADHNQLTMTIMKEVANRHGLECLLHEKPFAGINGSGKHNNWSICTDTGVNLLEPGETPHQNAQFILFLTAVIKAVDEYQDLIRVSAASAGNDHRLGANEAPPAIISIFLGEELTAIMEAISTGKQYAGGNNAQLELGVSSLPHFPKDKTDRNRTSPFAFTGNKFEFRMLGSALSVSGVNIVLNTIVAEVLREFADTLEEADVFTSELESLVKEAYTAHKRIVFNGDNYSEEWLAEAARRGLSNLKTTVDALPEFVSGKSIDLFTKHGVFDGNEMYSRYVILMEGYCKTLRIEALTMINITQTMIIPACVSYQNELVGLLQRKNHLEIDTTLESRRLKQISDLSAVLCKKLEALTQALYEYDDEDIFEYANYYKLHVFGAMEELRRIADRLEAIVSSKHWPLPSYGKLLYSVGE